MTDENSLGVKTKWFDLHATGQLVVLILLAILMNGIVTYFVIDEGHRHSLDHTDIMKWLEAVECRMNFDIYVHTIPEGQSITWYRMPKELRGCMPRYLMEREEAQQEIIKQKPPQ